MNEKCNNRNERSKDILISVKLFENFLFVNHLVITNDSLEMNSYKTKICLILLVLLVNKISGKTMKKSWLRFLEEEPTNEEDSVRTSLWIWIWILIGVFAAVFLLF